jgi:histidine triad (HIT) family protein
METIFSKIIKGTIPSVKLHEDALCISILDINPVCKGHLLVIAREPYPTIAECPIETLAHMMDLAKEADKKLRDTIHCDGTNIVINNGKASGQEVPHLHIHVIPRFEGDNQKFGFSKTTYADGEIAQYGEKLVF